MFDFDKYQTQVDDAIKTCIAHQDATGFEMGILLDCNGQPMFRTNGNENHIHWKESQLSIMSGGLIVHNHPSGASLSAEDCICAGAWGLSILACTKDGSRYIATPEGMRGTSFHERLSDAGNLFYRIAKGPAEEIAHSRARLAFFVHGMPESAVDIATGHEWMLELNAQIQDAKLNYHFKLSDTAIAAVAQWNQVMKCNLIADDSATYVSQSAKK